MITSWIENNHKFQILSPKKTFLGGAIALSSPYTYA